jgi:hypothetical protein
VIVSNNSETGGEASSGKTSDGETSVKDDDELA